MSKTAEQLPIWLTAVTVAEKQTWIGNWKWVTASEDFFLAEPLPRSAENVAKVVGATSSDGFPLKPLIRADPRPREEFRICCAGRLAEYS